MTDIAVRPRANSQGQRKKGNPELFTLLNRVPFGKFNRVNPEPLNAYKIPYAQLFHLVKFIQKQVLLEHLAYCLFHCTSETPLRNLFSQVRGYFSRASLSSPMLYRQNSREKLLQNGPLLNLLSTYEIVEYGGELFEERWSVSSCLSVLASLGCQVHGTRSCL